MINHRISGCPIFRHTCMKCTGLNGKSSKHTCDIIWLRTMFYAPLDNGSGTNYLGNHWCLVAAGKHQIVGRVASPTSRWIAEDTDYPAVTLLWPMYRGCTCKSGDVQYLCWFTRGYMWWWESPWNKGDTWKLSVFETNIVLLLSQKMGESQHFMVYHHFSLEKCTRLGYTLW